MWDVEVEIALHRLRVALYSFTPGMSNFRNAGYFRFGIKFLPIELS